MPSFMGRECIITAMPADLHYDGGSEADRKHIPAVRQPTLAVGGTTRYILSNAQLPVLMAH